MAPGSKSKARSGQSVAWSGIHSSSAQETRRAGAEFATYLCPGDVVALHGELGSGKSTFVGGMAEGLGLSDPVSSPTFALIHEYGRPPLLYHMDCYRETTLERWRQLGLSDYFGGRAVAVIEWAENIAPLLPRETIHLNFSHGEDESSRVVKVRS